MLDGRRQRRRQTRTRRCKAAVAGYQRLRPRAGRRAGQARDGVRRRGQGRRRRGGEGAVRRRALPLRDDRAGRRELRRPRPGDRRPRQRRRQGRRVDRLPPDRAGAVGEEHDEGHGAIARQAAGRRQRAQDQDRRTIDLPARAARQRRQRSCSTRSPVEDHRRGGPLLAHRPVGLPGQRRRAQKAFDCSRRRCARRTPRSRRRSTSASTPSRRSSTSIKTGRRVPSYDTVGTAQRRTLRSRSTRSPSRCPRSRRCCTRNGTASR